MQFANELMIRFNLWSGNNTSDPKITPKMWMKTRTSFFHTEYSWEFFHGSSSIQKLKKWYHSLSPKSETKVFIHLYSSQSNDLARYKLRNSYFFKNAYVKILQERKRKRPSGQACYSFLAVLTSPSSGLTWSPSAQVWHCCPLSCSHSGLQQLPAEGFGWLGPHIVL